MDKQSRFKETKSSEGAFEERDFYRESLSKLRLVRELQWIFYSSYLIVGLYVHDVRWRMWNKRNMRMFIPDKLASLLAWPVWIWYCDYFNHIMFMPVDAQKHVVSGEGISNFKIGRCIHCDSLLLEYDLDKQHHLFPVSENRFKEIFGFDHNMIFKG